MDELTELVQHKEPPTTTEKDINVTSCYLNKKKYDYSNLKFQSTDVKKKNNKTSIYITSAAHKKRKKRAATS